METVRRGDRDTMFVPRSQVAGLVTFRPGHFLPEPPNLLLQSEVAASAGLPRGAAGEEAWAGAVVRSTREKEAGPTQAALCGLGAQHRLLCARVLSRAPSTRGCRVSGSPPTPRRSPAPGAYTPTPSPLLPPHEKVSPVRAEAVCPEPALPTPRAEPGTQQVPWGPREEAGRAAAVQSRRGGQSPRSGPAPPPALAGPATQHLLDSLI